MLRVAVTSQLFEPMPTPQKHAFERAYLAQMRANDGEIDQPRRQLRRRESLLRELVEHPVVLGGAPPVEQRVFDRHHVTAAVAPTLDPAVVWAVATAKANLSERYAIELQLQRSAGGDLDPDDPQSYIDLEEHYHTRILADALATIGLTVTFGAPPLAMRILIAIMIRLPRAVANVVILAAELGGVVLFRLLLERARSLFADEPRALARIEALFGQILGDEIGHVLFVRARLGRVRLWLARRLLRGVAALYVHDVPELERLFGAGTLREQLLRIDLVELQRIHPDPVAAARVFAVLGLEADVAGPRAEAC